MIKVRFKIPTNLCRDMDRTLSGDKECVESRWTEYFKQILNSVQPEESQNEVTRIQRGVKIANEELVWSPPTKEELEEAVKVLKHNKAPGCDEIPSELWRCVLRPCRGTTSFGN
jgi:hypothetical protein